MIGGRDILIPTSAGASAIELALRLAAQIWPYAVYENAATGERYGQHAALPLGLVHEVLLHKSNPVKAKAFVQALGTTQNPDMLVMTWRILMGMSIASVTMDYTLSSHFSLGVVLESPYGESEEYHSDNIDDAALLHHFGIMKMDGKPMFDGFYPLNVKGA